MKDFERKSIEVASQQEKLQLLAEVMKVATWGDDMGSYGQSWGTYDSVESIDNGMVCTAKHKYNEDKPPLVCKFDKTALLDGYYGDKQLIARLVADEHTYDFIVSRNPQPAEVGDPDKISISGALTEMWNCEEVYDTVYDEALEMEVPRDPDAVVHMPASRYELSDYELLSVYVDLPPDRRALARTLGEAAEAFATILEEDGDSVRAVDTRFDAIATQANAGDAFDARQFEVTLGATEIDGPTARQLAKSLGEDYEISAV